MMNGKFAINMYKKILFYVCAVISIAACSSEELSEEVKGIKIANASIPQIKVIELDAPTRTSAELTKDNGYLYVKFGYVGNEKIVVFPNIGRPLDWSMKSLSSDKLNATFTTDAWALREGATYTAFQPYSDKVINEGTNTAVAVDYTGQSIPKAYLQTQEIDYLSEYDFQYAKPLTPTNGTAAFTFNRINSMLYLKVPYQNAGEQYTKLEIVIPENKNAKFTLKGNINLLSGNLTATETSKSFSIELQNIYGTVNSNGKLTGCYIAMWLAPMTIPAGTKVNLYGSLATKTFTFDNDIPLESNTFVSKSLNN